MEPADGSTHIQGVPIRLTGSSFDPETFAPLPCSSLSWLAQVLPDGRSTQLGTGCTVFHTYNVAVDAVFRLVATDDDGAEAVDDVTVEIVEAPMTGPPMVTIEQPTLGQLLQPDDAVMLTGSAIDPDDPDGLLPLDYEWLWQASGSRPIPIGTGSTFSWTPSDDVGFSCGGRSGTIILRVTDDDAETGQDEVDVRVAYPPC
jgi:hypothetical protein